ncbi:Cleavage and polyadenylation specificity factor, 73 kDa subunit [Enterospora canceri]|uniref:Endoribonuclease YSH1 n=1 Tax=Enterospora canceri TaxID=1081671 RepID=A0A1Y1S9D3_9MICR|nr:Cleavage and polyadenylation specificity factor, 73 kDa subunit [Enterospora canceri]
MQFLMDCGVHPAHTGVSSLPFLDLVNLEEIDAVFITHFHLDHAAALPFLTEKTNFRGKVFMTHPTKAILRWLLNDYIRIINSNSDEDFYTEKDLENCYNKITPIDYHQVIEVLEGVKMTAFNAGHVLGAAMFMLEIEQTKLLYTGDFSKEDDRHLKSAESPGCKMDILVTESTYGTQCHLPRVEREARFIKVVTDVVERGGKCLLPVFALGRAQELLLILDEHWEEHPRLKKIPIFYASALAKKCMGIYQTYINMMNERMQRLSLTRNPFEFKNVENIKDARAVRDGGSCVIMASPGMLQSGVSRDLFERWCGDSKNGVIIAGYSVDGTLAKEILKEPKEIESQRGQMLKLNMTVEYISFSAHVDYTQNAEFIYDCMPNHLFFVHGEATEMMRLKNSIQAKNEKDGIEMELYTLRNGEEAGVPVLVRNDCRVHTAKTEFDGLIVKTGKDVDVYELDDAIGNEFMAVTLTQRQKIPFNSTFDLVRSILINDFDAVEENGKFQIENVLVFSDKDEVVIEWENDYCSDIVAMALFKALDDLGDTSKSIRLLKMQEKEALINALKGYFVDVKEKNKKIIVDGIVEIKNGIASGKEAEKVEQVQGICNKIQALYHAH